jgi:putative NADH-flavin reductase
MNLVLLGATGRTGKELLGRALDSGHNVTIVVRDPSKVSIKNDRLQIVRGNAKDVTVLTKAFKNQEAVLSTLGISRKNMDYLLIQESTKAIIIAAEINGVKRVIIMSSFAALQEQLGLVTKKLTGVVLGRVITDVLAAAQLLKKSNLNWTLVYAVRLTNKPKSGNVRVIPRSEKLRLTNHISRSDVANYMLNQLEKIETFKKSVVIASK